MSSGGGTEGVSTGRIGCCDRNASDYSTNQLIKKSTYKPTIKISFRCSPIKFTNTPTYTQKNINIFSLITVYQEKQYNKSIKE